MKTSELTGAALDWAVAKCENNWSFEPDGCDSYSTDWELGGPIIEREKISLRYDCIDIGNGTCGWVAESWDKNGEHFEESGPTPLVAAMRCYVASKLGDGIEIPEEFKEGAE